MTDQALRDAVRTVPWGRLAHAYAAAWDAPDELRTLLAPEVDAGAVEAAMDWVWSCALHQGSVYSATPPVVWLLTDLAAARPDHPAVRGILYAVQAVAEAAAFLEPDDGDRPLAVSEAGAPLWEAWVDAPLPAGQPDPDHLEPHLRAARVRRSTLIAVLDHAAPVVQRLSRSADPAVRSAAIAAIAAVLPVRPQEQALADVLRSVLDDPDAAPDALVSACAILGPRGEDLRPWLDHDDRRRRLAAAMATSTADDPRSVRALADAIADPDWLESAFPDGAAHVDMHLRFHVLAALLARTRAADADATVIDAVCTLIRTRAGKFTVDHEWGPALAWAFADRRVPLPLSGPTAPLPTTLTAAQRAVLEAVCAKAELWDPTWGNAIGWFLQLQLPYDRTVCRGLLARPWWRFW